MVPAAAASSPFPIDVCLHWAGTRSLHIYSNLHAVTDADISCPPCSSLTGRGTM